MYLIEQKIPFSQSRIWQLQREYFTSAGIDAWRSGQVPHYLTSNPVVGKTYAELVLALLRDLSLKGQHNETVYVLELGAGHGRLCYHFFKHFEKYYEQSAIPLPPFCYVLSDFTESSLDFWRDHPRLQPYLEKGWLDFTLFDVESSNELSLSYTGLTLSVQSFSQPLVVIANYFFDTIPQALFRVTEKKISRAFLTLTTTVDPAGLHPAELIDALELQYDYEEVQTPVYVDDPAFNDLLEVYREQLLNSHLLLPDTGIRCLERLRKLSRQGLILLTADKGDHHVSSLDYNPEPVLVTHGSFSTSVNYHAIGQYCTSQGGVARFPRHQHEHLDLGCLLFLVNADSYQETLQAYERFVGDYGPDDFFMMKKLIEPHFAAFSYADTLSVLRLSGYDARLFQQMLPRLFEILPTITDNERWNLLLAVPRIWDTYFPLGETEDLAANLGDLLVALNFYQEAILYFELSVYIYGKKADVYYKIALCHCLVGDFSTAAPLLNELLVYAPDNEEVQALIREVNKNRLDLWLI
ncbi:hypothetical protein [Spirosoma sp.]|uniref:tetratricopeptide repeat protein n=1 Tax=Spirosoma sp. TaxID=1899569 RepID=UPI002635B0BE|nr:hypothetical protein [Spirosoma sp.]MCX6219088.1 hypothetical protein [Spirosoma sp.]